MRIELTLTETRVIGCLVEKEVITPDQYPLSLSALTHACNQKSSRDPVMQLSESEVQRTLDELMKKHLVSDRGSFGSRVTKYQHRFCNLGFGSLEFSKQELAIICVLLLRGAQTPGELRTRTNRLCDFSDVHEAEQVLHGLMTREDGPFVARLEREPGKRESRYVHLFSGEAEEIVDMSSPPSQPVAQSVHSEPVERTDLESLVTQLNERLGILEKRIDELEKGG
jgi:uncharacterized protein YceH (UPF0502 family)